MPAGPFSPAHDVARSRDGTPIAFFEVLPPPGEPRTSSAHPPLLLVHGAAADHTTWRASGPVLARRRVVVAMDRRGRGASGDVAGQPYSIEREYEDVAAVAEALASRTARPAVDVAGHSYGGRAALGGSLVTETIRRVVVYEGAPVPPGLSYRSQELVDAVRASLARGDREGALSTFLQGIVGLSDAAMEAYRREAVWPARVAAAPTILREIEAEGGPAASIEALRRTTAPVLLLLGSVSRSPFRIGTDALADALADARIEVIKGAAHAAHHTHVDAFVRLVERFLDR
jgi:pimeloyl-ACP methyl ester carboxylesterase